MLRIIIASLFLSLISTFSSAETVTLKCKNTVIKYIDNWVTKDEVVVRKNAAWQPYCDGNYKITDGGVSCKIEYEDWFTKYRELNSREKLKAKDRLKECKKALNLYEIGSPEIKQCDYDLYYPQGYILDINNYREWRVQKEYKYNFNSDFDIDSVKIDDGRTWEDKTRIEVIDFFLKERDGRSCERIE